ncbi:MAG: hypothetical protein V3W37_02415 [Candidatus Binatia bacterium]
MARYHGSDYVEIGFYCNTSRWEIITVPKGGGSLPGENEETYIRLPLLLVMLLGPLMGGLYVIFLPLIGFVILFGFVGKKLFLIVKKFVGKLMYRAEAAPNEER